MPQERLGRSPRARPGAPLLPTCPPRQLSWADVARIDRERLWGATRGLQRGALLQLLQRALEQVPAEQLEHVLGDHFTAGEVGAPAGEAAPALRAEVEQLCELAEAGVFYEVIPYRGREQSRGTQEFAARFNALLQRCASEPSSACARDLRVSIEALLGLLRAIDEGRKDIVYFTDEGGSWQLRTLWARVLPRYFECLARTSSEGEYRSAVEAALHDFATCVVEPGVELRRLAEQLWSARRTDTPFAPPSPASSDYALLT